MREQLSLCTHSDRRERATVYARLGRIAGRLSEARRRNDLIALEALTVERDETREELARFIRCPSCGDWRRT